LPWIAEVCRAAAADDDDDDDAAFMRGHNS
jgi:hypothetical protein